MKEVTMSYRDNQFSINSNLNTQYKQIDDKLDKKITWSYVCIHIYLLIITYIFPITCNFGVHLNIHHSGKSPPLF